jgi:hypothetical protein
METKGTPSLHVQGTKPEGGGRAQMKRTNETEEEWKDW